MTTATRPSSSTRRPASALLPRRLLAKLKMALVEHIPCTQHDPTPYPTTRKITKKRTTPLPPSSSSSSPSPPPAHTCDANGACDLDDFPADLAVADDLPSAALLKECGELLLYAADGTTHTFKSLFSPSSSSSSTSSTSSTTSTPSRHLIIFTRHFLCGMCQDYLRALAAHLTPQALASTSPRTSVSIISCMQPALIAAYVRNTHCPFPVYADPARALYAKLGLLATLDLGPVRPRYQVTPMPEMVLKAIGQGVREGTGVFKVGNMRQVGGDFLFESAPGTGLRVAWCHRMRNTRDHTDAGELARRLGIAGAEA